MKTCDSFLYMIFALLKVNPLSVTTYGDLIGKLIPPMLKGSTASLPFIYFLTSGFFSPKEAGSISKEIECNTKEEMVRKQHLQDCCWVVDMFLNTRDRQGQEKLLFSKPNVIRKNNKSPSDCAFQFISICFITFGWSSSQISALKY